MYTDPSGELADGFFDDLADFFGLGDGGIHESPNPLGTHLPGMESHKTATGEADQSTESAGKYDWNYSALSTGGIIMGGLVADDGTGVGIADDVLIPIVAVGAAIGFAANNSDNIGYAVQDATRWAEKQVADGYNWMMSEDAQGGDEASGGAGSGGGTGQTPNGGKSPKDLVPWATGAGAVAKAGGDKMTRLPQFGFKAIDKMKDYSQMTAQQLVSYVRGFDQAFRKGAVQSMTRDQAAIIARQARRLGVYVRIDKGHPRSDIWTMPHLNVGPKQGKFHVPFLPK
jgi:hypothetical protein